MMIVVFGHEVQMVDQSHWRSKSRMRDRSGEQVGFKVADSIHEPQSCLSKLHKNILDAAPGYAPLHEFFDCSGRRL